MPATGVSFPESGCVRSGTAIERTRFKSSPANLELPPEAVRKRFRKRFRSVDRLY